MIDTYIYESQTCKTVSFGRKGENLARRIMFDLSALIAEFGAGTFEWVIRRPHESTVYIAVNKEQDGNTAILNLTTTETAISGYGGLELRYYVDDAIVKTIVWRTSIAASLGGGDVPDPIEDYIDQMREIAQEASESADAAGDSATQAAVSATNAAGSATEAAGYDANAAASAGAAADSATNSAASATAAYTSEVNAANSATQASDFAIQAANSASAASGSASQAASSVTQAAGSASAAANSATQAAQSATAATQSATAANQSAQDIAASSAQIETNRTDITDLKNGFNSIIEESNLFVPSTVVENVRLDGAGRTTPVEGYFTSAFIPVEVGWVVTKNSPVIDNYHRIGVYSSASNNALIEGQLFNENQITIPEGGAYVRICGLSTEVDSTTVTHRSAVDSVARGIAQTAINSVQSVTDKLDVISVTGNQFDPSTVQANTRLDGAGRTTSGDGYFTSAFIPVSEGCTVVKNSPVENVYHRIAVYSEANNSAMVEGQLFTSNTITVTKGGKYIRICGLNTEINNTTVIVNTAIDESARCLANHAVDMVDSSYLPQLRNVLGSDRVVQSVDTLTGGSIISVANYPKYLKKNTFVSFYGKFSTFTGLKVGKGYNTYRGDWVEVTASDVIFHHYESNTDNTVQTDAHGLTISDYVSVILYLDTDGRLNCSVNSIGGTFSTYIQTNYDVFSGDTFAVPSSDMTDVELSASNGDTKKPVWCIGDSYFGVNEQRVLGQLKALGFWNGVLFDGLAGLNSQNAYDELTKLFSLGTPKMLIWYLGMNDSNTNYYHYLTLVKTLCESKGVTLVLNKVPSVPNLEKETIGGYVEASGCRYINSYLAVGSSVGGAWYTGFLSSDNVHPTALGAKALAMHMLVDVPELAEYGFKL